MNKKLRRFLTVSASALMLLSVGGGVSQVNASHRAVRTSQSMANPYHLTKKDIREARTINGDYKQIIELSNYRNHHKHLSARKTKGLNRKIGRLETQDLKLRKKLNHSKSYQSFVKAYTKQQRKVEIAQIKHLTKYSRRSKAYKTGVRDSYATRTHSVRKSMKRNRQYKRGFIAGRVATVEIAQHSHSKSVIKMARNEAKLSFKAGGQMVELSRK